MYHKFSLRNSNYSPRKFICKKNINFNNDVCDQYTLGLDIKPTCIIIDNQY